MLAAGRSPAAADTGAKDSNGTTRSASHSQAAEARPVSTQPDDKAIAEMQAFRPPAAPWQIRFRKHIVAAVAVAATVGFAALATHLWRTLGPSRLDAVTVELPEERTVIQRDATPASLPAAPAARPAVTVTHSKGAEPRPQPRAGIQEQRPASPAECSEAVAALNLCPSTPSNKAAQ